MTARRKFYAPLRPIKNPGYKKPVGKPPPCPQALCQCGHKRSAHEGQLGCFDSGNCDCKGFVLAKPAKKRWGPCPLPPHRPAKIAAEPCSVCGPAPYHRMCASCGRSYDRRVKTDDGTALSILHWAANRARKAERARNRSKP